MRYRTRALLIGAALLIPVPRALAQRFELIEPGATARYLKGVSEASTPVSAWRQPLFDDSAWPVGQTSIGYGDNDDRTPLPDMRGSYVTVYLRLAFTVPDPAAVTALHLDLSYDDGFVAYLNGAEVARAQMPPAAPTFDTLALPHEASGPERFDLSAGLGGLSAGTNLLAIEIHNDSLISSDLSLTPRLFAYGQNPVTRGPYLQLQEATSVLVAWRTAQASIGEVAFGSASLDQMRVESAPTTDHAVRVDGLLPGSSYRYQIGERGQPSQPAQPMYREGQLSAARPPGDRRFRVVALGDGGIGTLAQWNVARLIEGLAPDLLVHVGDVIYDAGQDFYYDPRFFEPYRRIVDRAVLWPSLGNHDWLTGGGQPFTDAFHLPPGGDPAAGEHYYSFRYADTVFFALDSTPHPVAGDAQYDWLERELRAAQDCYKVVYFHHPPYSSGTDHGSDLPLRASLTPLFDQYDVDLVLNGHDHDFERTFPLEAGLVTDQAQEPDYVDPQGTIYFVTGGGGNTLNPVLGDPVWTAHGEQLDHVVVLDRDGDTWTFRAVAVDGSPLGSEVDRATLTRTTCAVPGFTILRSPNKLDVPLSPWVSTTARTYTDPQPAASIFYYQVDPAALLLMHRAGTDAVLDW